MYGILISQTRLQILNVLLQILNPLLLFLNLFILLLGILFFKASRAIVRLEPLAYWITKF